MSACILILVIAVLALPISAAGPGYENHEIPLESSTPEMRQVDPEANRIILADEIPVSDIDWYRESGTNKTGSGIQYLGSCLWNDLYDMYIEDGLMYCQLTYGLMILDARQGLPFDTLSTLYLHTSYGRGQDLYKCGNYVYFTRLSEVVVIDVTDPAQPFIVSTYPYRDQTAGLASSTELVCADDVLYLVDGDSGLTILDVSDPASPALLSQVPPLDEEVRHVAVEGSTAFVSACNEFHVLNVADPSSPEILASETGDMYSCISRAILNDGLAYAIKFDHPSDSLVIFNLSDPANPVQVGGHQSSDSMITSTEMILSDSLLFTACEIINVSDPSAPVSISSYSLSCSGSGLGLWNDNLYRAGPRYIHVWDVADLQDPQYMDIFYLPGYIQTVRVQDNLAYAGLLFQGLVILDISDFQHPVLLGELEGYSDYDYIDVQDNILCNGNHVIDVSDPANPVIIADLISGEISDVCLRNDLAFVAKSEGYRGNTGLFIFDVSDPANPILLSQYEANIAQIALQDTLAFLALSASSTVAGVHIVNYAAPFDPQLVGAYGERGSSVVAVGDSVMYTTQSSNLHAVDVRDPANPVLLGIYDDPFVLAARRMAVRDDYLYVAQRYRSLQVFDVSDPTTPTLVETFRTPSEGSHDIFMTDSVIYLADYYGLMFLSTYAEQPATTVSFDVKPGSCPNPINWRINPNGKSVLPVAIPGSAELDVHDIDVSSVRLLGDLIPVRFSYEDVTAAMDETSNDCACTEAGPDGYEDLALKFDRRSVLETLHLMPEADEYVISVSATLNDGELIEGQDCVYPVGRGQSQEVSNISKSSDASNQAQLLGSWPNPFNPSTEIRFSLPEGVRVSLQVYNVTGQRVATLADGYFDAGEHVITWDGRDVSGRKAASGVYFYRFQAGEIIQTRKMVLMK